MQAIIAKIRDDFKIDYTFQNVFKQQSETPLKSIRSTIKKK